MKNKLFIVALIVLVGTPLISYSADTTPTNNQKTIQPDKKPLYWVDTMEPNVHYSAPGKSRMGMTLQPVYQKADKNLN